jgi:hypothetical protein
MKNRAPDSCTLKVLSCNKGDAYAGTVDKMDWVMMRGALVARSAEIIRTSRGGRYPSDHYFVSGTFAFSESAPRAVG